MSRNAIKDKNGSAIIWSVIVLAMLTAFVVAALTIAYSYHQRSLRYYEDRQAYFTSRSAAVSLAKKLVSEDALLMPKKVGDTINSDISFPPEMGKCTAQIKRVSDDVITVTATTKYLEQTASFTARVTRMYAEVYNFSGGLYTRNLAPNSAFAVQGDIYLYDSTAAQLSARVSGNFFSIDMPLSLYSAGYVSGSILSDSVTFVGSLQKLPQSIVARRIVNVPSSVMRSTVDSITNVIDPVTVPDVKYDFDSGPNQYLIGASVEKEFIVDSSPSADGYYLISKLAAQELTIEKLTSTGSGTVYVCVNSDVTLNIESFNLAKDSKIVFVLRDNATLNLKAKNEDVKLSVYGTDKSSVSCESMTVTGDIYTGTFSADNGFLLATEAPAAASKLLPAGYVLSKYTKGAD
ncbi:MAG: hypothetical protein RRY69_01205 [Oscillospiraceae bacterium]